jgi:hypothetical protein
MPSKYQGIAVVPPTFLLLKELKTALSVEQGRRVTWSEVLALLAREHAEIATLRAANVRLQEIATKVAERSLEGLTYLPHLVPPPSIMEHVARVTLLGAPVVGRDGLDLRTELLSELKTLMAAGIKLIPVAQAIASEMTVDLADVDK